jgi:hypothetical protein
MSDLHGLLEKLKLVDRSTYDKYFGAMIRRGSSNIFVVEASTSINQAWLQMSLQDKIYESGWSLYQISNPGLPGEEKHFAHIISVGDKPVDDIECKAFGQSRCSALLKAYFKMVERK